MVWPAALCQEVAPRSLKPLEIASWNPLTRQAAPSCTKRGSILGTTQRDRCMSIRASCFDAAAGHTLSLVAARLLCLANRLIWMDQSGAAAELQHFGTSHVFPHVRLRPATTVVPTDTKTSEGVEAPQAAEYAKRASPNTSGNAGCGSVVPWQMQFHWL